MSQCFTTLRDCGRVFSQRSKAMNAVVAFPEGSHITVQLVRSRTEPEYFDLVIRSAVPDGLDVDDAPTQRFIENIFLTTDTSFFVEANPHEDKDRCFVSSRRFTTDCFRQFVGTVHQRIRLHHEYVKAVELRS